ncbi:uncharacterized protein [Notamacropus eugenii]|uniref:uncharacterized protein n=1 Tax=Notamacropus eugenii TaxID=9315 RepID=UPI003B673332
MPLPSRLPYCHLPAVHLSKRQLQLAPDDRKKRESHGTNTRYAILQDLPSSSPVTPPPSPLPLEELEPRRWARSRARHPSGKKKSKDGRVGDGCLWSRAVSPGRCWAQVPGASSSIPVTIRYLKYKPKEPRQLWFCRCPSVPSPSTRAPSRILDFGDRGNSSKRTRWFCASVPPYFPSQCRNSKAGGISFKVSQPSCKTPGERKKEKPERHVNQGEKKRKQNVINKTEFGPQILGELESSVPTHLTYRFRELPRKMRSAGSPSPVFERCRWAEEKNFFKSTQKDGGKSAQKPERKSGGSKKFQQHTSTPRNETFILSRRSGAGKVK